MIGCSQTHESNLKLWLVKEVMESEITPKQNLLLVILLEFEEPYLLQKLLLGDTSGAIKLPVTLIEVQYRTDGIKT